MTSVVAQSPPRIFEKNALIELEGADGSYHCLSGDGMGAQGVTLGLNPTGLYEAAVATIWQESAYQWGATPGGHRYQKRDLVLGFNIMGDTPEEWEDVLHRFRRAWSYKKQSKLVCTSRLGGRRELKLQLSEQPSMEMQRDPRIRAYSNFVVTAVAKWPFWEQDPAKYNFIGSGAVAETVLHPTNPTDVEAFVKWSLSAPAQWVLPDFSFGSQEYGLAVEHASRVLVLPPITVSETIDTDPLEARVIANDGSNAWGKVKGEFLYPIPEFTEEPVNLPVRYLGGNPSLGAGAQLIVERNWLGPW